MLKDTKPEEREVLVSGSSAVIHEKQPAMPPAASPKSQTVAQTPAVTDDEPAPPAPFVE